MGEGALGPSRRPVGVKEEEERRERKNNANSADLVDDDRGKLWYGASLKVRLNLELKQRVLDNTRSDLIEI